MEFRIMQLAGRTGLGRTGLGLALAAGLAVLAGGCSSIRDHRGYLADAALVDSVQPGVDNRTSVERTLGRPTFISQFGDSAWYYVSQDTTQKAFRRPRTKQQTILRVRFDPAGNVAAVDRAAMEKVVRLDPNGDKTPTLGRDRGLLEDLFGNIGTVGAPGMGGGGGSGGGPNGS
jgi:outer membrane protein assembly factor BamE (lipoprotein component of BamABCDE complex)